MLIVLLNEIKVNICYFKFIKQNIILSGILIFNHTQAATSVSTVQANANIASSCIISFPNVVFGTYDPNSSASLAATQNVSILCTKGTAYTYWSSTGADNFGAWNGYSVGIMNNSNGDPLYFQEYVANKGWLNDNNNYTTDHTSGVGTGFTQTLTYNYRVLPNQYVSPSNYSLTETASINF